MKSAARRRTQTIPITRWRAISPAASGPCCPVSTGADRCAVGTRARIEDAEERAALAATVDSEAFRLRLGRIACGYDGGQVVQVVEE